MVPDRHPALREEPKTVFVYIPAFVMCCVASDKDVGRDILTVAEQMHADITSQDNLDDDLMRKLRKQGEELERLADQLE